MSGRWPFASGSSHADWFAAECTIYDGEAERLDADGNAVTRMLFVPGSEVTLHDTWHTTDLRGTASNDFSVDGAFVPASRGFQVLVDPPRVDSPVYRALPLLFMNHGSQALGVARAALAAAAEIATAKRGWGGVSLAEVPRLQASLAEAVAGVESARAYLYDTAERLLEMVEDEPDDAALAPQRARLRLATSRAATASVRAVDLVHGALATSSIFTSSGRSGTSTRPPRT